ncbi:MAG: sugar phosphate isomerase/epimerase [Methanoregula sp.]|nr:sugar phosphate isomerase/epimerase [Methanoregula sp.]
MFGVSSFCLHQLPLADALEKISTITDRIEVMDEGLHYLESAELLRSYDHHFSIHAPSRGTNIASRLETIRRASVEVMSQCMKIAAEVGGGVVIHPGYYAWAEEREKSEQQLVRSIGELKKISEEYSVRFFIENMGNWEYFLLKTPEELPLIGDAPFALDVGHAHQMRQLDAFLMHPAAHYHLHDNAGKEDSHWAVGDGTIDFSDVMNAVRKSGVEPIIEVATYDGVVKSIERLNAL